MKKSVFTIAVLGLVFPLTCLAESVFSENWAQASATSIPGWVVIFGQPETTVVTTPAGQVLRAVPKANFMIRTDAAYAVGKDFAVRAHVAIPTDASKSGAGIGVRNEILGPEVGYRVLVNRDSNLILLFRLNGKAEIRLAEVSMPLPEGAFDLELQIRRKSDVGAALNVLLDGKSVLDHDDTEALALGSKVRVMIGSRSGKSIEVGKVDLVNL